MATIKYPGVPSQQPAPGSFLSFPSLMLLNLIMRLRLPDRSRSDFFSAKRWQSFGSCLARACIILYNFCICIMCVLFLPGSTWFATSETVRFGPHLRLVGSHFNHSNHGDGSEVDVASALHYMELDFLCSSTSIFLEFGSPCSSYAGFVKHSCRQENTFLSQF